MNDMLKTSIWKNEAEPKDQTDEFRNMDISELNLSVRSYNCLRRAGYHTVGRILDLLNEDENGLRRIRNLGHRSETEIRECLQRAQEEASRYPAMPHRSDAPKVRRFLIKPAKQIWNMEIREFSLSDTAQDCLKRCGIYRVGDLYTAKRGREPGWYAVRELFEKLS